MVEVSRYLGDVEQAARLQAARVSAGFATARKAAQQFGWPESRYISHEGAQRRLGRVALRMYAEAFSVSDLWLEKGTEVALPPFRDRTITIDPLRVKELRRRVQEQNHLDGTDLERGRRLRLARRLAGFGSVAAGALAVGVHRSTLDAAERGLTSLDFAKARTYAKAFGCEPAWLIKGLFPTGFPTEVEAGVEGWLKDDLTEREAALRLPRRVPSPAPLRASIVSVTKPAMAQGTPLPEHEIGGLVRLLPGPQNGARPATLPGWSMPRAFLEDVLHADHRNCVIVAVPKHIRAEGFAVSSGDRLVIDTVIGEVLSAVYAVVLGEVLAIADAKTPEGKRLAVKAKWGQQGLVLLGEVVAIVSAVRRSGG